ncbi:hypothetical protein TNCV_3156211 [Trichonephila clavipes]|nr:hypothetical protein TNCV_3156211 [Trichonephila clavipes]
MVNSAKEQEVNISPTLKTTCENSGRRKNVARQLISVGLASAKKRVANGASGECSGANVRNAEQQQVPANPMHPAFVLFVVRSIIMKLMDRNECNDVALIHHLGCRRNVASSAKGQKVQDSKCNRKSQTWWTEKYGMIRKGDKAVCVCILEQWYVEYRL